MNVTARQGLIQDIAKSLHDSQASFYRVAKAAEIAGTLAGVSEEEVKEITAEAIQLNAEQIEKEEAPAFKLCEDMLKRLGI